MRHTPWMALGWAVLLAASVGSAAPLATPTSGRPTLVWLLAAPFVRRGTPASGPFQHGRALVNSTALAGDAGWTHMEFPVREPVSGLFLAVQGKAEFETAAVRFDDGEVSSVDLHGAKRS